MEEANKKMSPWRAAERAYYGHHAGCPQCKAAGQCNGSVRCGDGLKLWRAYEAAPLPWVLEGPSRPSAPKFTPRR